MGVIFGIVVCQFLIADSLFPACPHIKGFKASSGTLACFAVQKAIFRLSGDSQAFQQGAGLGPVGEFKEVALMLCWASSLIAKTKAHILEFLLCKQMPFTLSAACSLIQSWKAGPSICCSRTGGRGLTTDSRPGSTALYIVDINAYRKGGIPIFCRPGGISAAGGGG